MKSMNIESKYIHSKSTNLTLSLFASTIVPDDDNPQVKTAFDSDDGEEDNEAFELI